MGVALVAHGAAFRTWAPRARAVHAVGDFNGWRVDDASLLARDAHGHWLGFVDGVRAGQRYMFHVEGDGGAGLKRDPRARELTPDFPWRCIVREHAFPWHETGFATPRFEGLVLYQLHVGSFARPRGARRGGTFLDVALRLPHLASLGVTALQLLPVQEFTTRFSLGYNGTDLYAPEMSYCLADDTVAALLPQVNALLDAKGLRRYAARDLSGGIAQLKALVDLAHVHGLAVLFDVVYNHAGGGFDDESIHFFDRRPVAGGNAESLYFSDRGHAGGLVFDFASDDVRDFLIANARHFLDEYRIDGFRYDQVSVIDHDGAPHGWRFCQDLTGTLRHAHPHALNLAEYWNVEPLVVAPPPRGAGFDAALTDGLRLAIRDVVEGASHPDARPLAMTRLGASLWPAGFDASWRFVQGPENHDVVLEGREPRIARLGQADDPRSWHARSRARVATGLALAAPGMPMLFMGQELLAPDPWSDDVDAHPDLLLDWGGVDGGDRVVADHVRFVRELLALRRRLAALRADGFAVIHAHDANRVLAFQRWVPGRGDDVVVVAHLSPFHRFDYRIGFPSAGRWREAFNSDAYEDWVNPHVVGNGGSVVADGPPLHGLAQSASLALPANGLLVFAGGA